MLQIFLPWVFTFGFGKLSRNTAGKWNYLSSIICGNLFGNSPWLFIDIYFFPILWSRSCFYFKNDCAYQSLNWFRKLKVILLVFSISSNLIKRWITFQEPQWQQEISNNYSVPNNLEVLQQLSLLKVKVDSWPSLELTIMDLFEITENMNSLWTWFSHTF